MRFSLWMLQEHFIDLMHKIHCSDSFCDINDFQLYTDKAFCEDHTLYIGSARELLEIPDDRLVLWHRGNYIILQTTDLVMVTNRVFGLFRYYYDWEERCRTTIHQGSGLQTLLDLGSEALGVPLLIMDDAQFLLAHSSKLMDIYDSPEMRTFLEHRTWDEKALQKFNKEFHGTFYTKESFFIPSGVFPSACLCHNIYLDSCVAAILIMALENSEYTNGIRQLFEKFVPFVQEWILVHSSEDSSNHLTASFAQLLDGKPGSISVLQRGLSLQGWAADCRKQVLVAASLSEQFHFDAFLSRSVSRDQTWLFAIPFRKRLIALLNLDLISGQEAYKSLSAWMMKNAYYGAVSTEFRELLHAGTALEQAEIVLRGSKQEAGHIHFFHKHAMRYVTSFVQTYSALSIIHPLVEAMAAYDAEHQTAFCATLYSYLRNERNRLKTSAELYIHRNTLAQRLERIQELWNPELEDPEERLYLMYSFCQMASGQEYMSDR